MWKYKFVNKYLQFARKAFAVTKAGGKVQISWSGDALDLQGFRKKFMKALHKRINAKAGIEATGRKLQLLYQDGLIRDQRRISDKVNGGVIVYQFETPEITKKFGYLLSEYGED